MRVLVTGASGRLGNVVVRELLSQGDNVTALVANDGFESNALLGLDCTLVYGDILDKESLREILNGFEIVYHLAAKIVLDKDKDGTIWAVNYQGAVNIASICLEKSIKLIHCSSHHAYEKHPYEQPLDESRPLALDEMSTYHRAKAHGEAFILKLIKENGLQAIVVAPGTLCGPLDFEPSIFAKALIDLCHGKIPALMEGRSDYADVRDVAKGIVMAAKVGRVGERYLLGGNMLDMRQLSILVGKLTGKRTPSIILPIGLMKAFVPIMSLVSKINKKPPLFTIEMLEASQSTKEVSYQKASIELGYSPRPVEESLKDAFEWYRTNGWLKN